MFASPDLGVPEPPESRAGDHDQVCELWRQPQGVQTAMPGAKGGSG
ncbi:hypothetical protein EYZ11_012506 [Aspergillus tanneri]|uniref:Uncharacterized protein n=1 Tax=Aspergillus tanneri TaxID=1220188 RepID=A0A4S3J0N4_9EURO|nr:hypothetical protein EYZ11_012506 [Aspergillus tanneri]